jgi:catechol 2,3-dioxygenase-like lactoylglutathione lyase family enzyme
MEQALHVITLGVADLERSRDFYVRGLGWTPTLDLAGVVFLQVNHGLLMAIFPLADLGADAGHPASPGTPFSLGQNVSSEQAVTAVIESARAAGATVLKEPQRADWGGFHGYFADPDGHRWDIVFNPSVSIGADGTVRFSAPSGA